jgi:hypothetical protein
MGGSETTAGEAEIENVVDVQSSRSVSLVTAIKLEFRATGSISEYVAGGNAVC